MSTQHYFIAISFLPGFSFHCLPSLISLQFHFCLSVNFIAYPALFHCNFILAWLLISLPTQHYFIAISFPPGCQFHCLPSLIFIAISFLPGLLFHFLPSLISFLPGLSFHFLPSLVSLQFHSCPGISFHFLSSLISFQFHSCLAFHFISYLALFHCNFISYPALFHSCLDLHFISYLALFHSCPGISFHFLPRLISLPTQPYFIPVSCLPGF